VSYFREPRDGAACFAHMARRRLPRAQFMEFPNWRAVMTARHGGRLAAILPTPAQGIERELPGVVGHDHGVGQQPIDRAPHSTFGGDADRLGR